MKSNRERAKRYEEDLNKARDEIQKAQLEMKNIDSEVNNFHQKMTTSMKSLLKAFTEGFEAMDKAKGDEVAQLQIEKAERDTKRVKKLSKISSGISGLEALTSKLKMSFNDEEKIQTSEDIHADKKEEPKNSSKVAVKKEKNSTKVDPKTLKLKEVPQGQKEAKPTVKSAAKPAASSAPKSAGKPVVKTIKKTGVRVPVAKVPEHSDVKTAVKTAPKTQAKVAQKKAAQPAAKTLLKTKKANAPVKTPVKAKTPVKSKKPAGAKIVTKTIIKPKPAGAKNPQTAASKAQLKNKMKALLASSAKKKAVGGKKTLTLKKQPLTLAQTSVDSEELTKENAKEKLQQLLETQQKVRKLTAALGNQTAAQHVENLAKSLGVDMKEEMKSGSNEVIAHHLAGKVLAQLGKDKNLL